MISASEYVDRGLALVAIPTGQKGPTGKGWNKAKNAITSPADAALLSGNIGLAHAYCATTPTMALDIDDMARAKMWLAMHRIDVGALLDADHAVQIISGRPGRTKLIYRLPPGLVPLESLTIKEKIEAEGRAKQTTVLEFRCATRNGLTVQDVLPPSIHPDTGQPYKWAGKGDWRALPVIPDALLALWQQELDKQIVHRTRPNTRLSLFKGIDDTPRQRARVGEMLRFVSADCGYEMYRDMVWAILSLGWQDAEDIAEQWCQTAPDRFEDVDFWNVVNSHDLSRSQTIGTIIYHARAGGWNG